MNKIGRLEYKVVEPYNRVFLHKECDDVIDSYINYKDEFDPVKTGLMLNLKYINATIDGNINRRGKIYPTQENAKVWSVHIIDMGPNLRAMMMFIGYRDRKCAFLLDAFSEKGTKNKCRRLYTEAIKRTLLRCEELVREIGEG